MEFDKEFTPKHQRLCGVPLGVSVLSTQRLRERRSRCLQLLNQTVTVRDTTGGTLPSQVVLRNNCTLSKRLPHEHSIDAKSVFDALIKECAGNRQDRRTAVDLAIVRETLKAQGSHIRWIPHPLMPADSMTKADPSAGNDALRHLLRTGKLVWDEETIRWSARLGRTKAVSRRQLENNDKTLHGT